MQQQISNLIPYYISESLVKFDLPYNESVKFVYDRKTLLFDPQNDMTPIESARICQLFCLTSFSGFNAPKFIENHNLLRHFKEEQ